MDSSDQGGFDRARFATVLRNLKRDSIPSFASAVRYSGHHSTGIIDVPATPRPVRCRLLSHTTCGSFNAVFNILFADGTLWVLKIPANGHRQCWDVPAREALTSEAFTMRLIRHETTIPVPEIFVFDASLENELGCPFILMEFIHGKPLHEVWFAQGVSQALREQIRIRTLQGIAEAMTQLNSLTFNQGGSILFDAKGRVIGIGSSNIVDLETQYGNMRSSNYDYTVAFSQLGPFIDPETYLLSLLDAHEGKSERCEIEKGAYKLLRLFIKWSAMDTTPEDKPFVLAHADLDKQNILVRNDGSLAGIIDWDWIAAVPRCIGCQSLPKFLAQDYDPAGYAYDVEAGGPIEGYFADSPAELACYRAIYAQFMESYLSKEDRMNLTKSRRHAAHVRKSRKQAADLTRRSLITTTLHLAAKAPSQMKKSMVHLFDQIEELTAEQWPDESSTVDSAEQDGGEEAGKRDAETEESGVDDYDAARKVSGTNKADFEENVTSIEHLSIDELMEEIEKLTAISSVDNPISGTVLKSPKSEESPSAESKTVDLEVDSYETGTKEHIEEGPKPRVARVCGWFKNKLHRGGHPIIKNSEEGSLSISADSQASSRPKRATRIALGWTEKKLRRMAACLHCDSDDKDEANVDSKVQSMRNRGIDVLLGLQEKLQRLREKLHCKAEPELDAPASSDAEASQNQLVINRSRELTRAEKRSVCADFAHMVQDNRICLTIHQQASIAHWIIQTLQKSEFSDQDPGTTRGNGGGMAERHNNLLHSKDGGPGNESGYEEGRGGKNGDHTDGHEDNGATEGDELQDDGKKAASDDQADIEQPSEDTGPTSDVEDLKETSRATVESEAEDLIQEDTGAFEILDVCIALARDSLDEGRMHRLREGFFGLLNQTM